MKIHIRYFASLREIVGHGDEVLTLPEGSQISSVRTLLVSHYPSLQRVLERAVSAVNHQYVSNETILREGDELVFIPPTGGGQS